MCEELVCVCVCFNCGADAKTVGTSENRYWCEKKKRYEYETILNLYTSDKTGELVCVGCMGTEEMEKIEAEELAEREELRR
jgi:hypothetical protein